MKLAEREMIELCRRLRSYPTEMADRIFSRRTGTTPSMGEPCYMKMNGLARSCNDHHDGPCRPFGYGALNTHSLTLMRDGRFLLYIAQIQSTQEAMIEELTAEAQGLGFEVDIDHAGDLPIMAYMSEGHTAVSVYHLEDCLGTWWAPPSR